MLLSLWHGKVNQAADAGTHCIRRGQDAQVFMMEGLHWHVLYHVLDLIGCKATSCDAQALADRRRRPGKQRLECVASKVGSPPLAPCSVTARPPAPASGAPCTQEHMGMPRSAARSSQCGVSVPFALK